MPQISSNAHPKLAMKGTTFLSPKQALDALVKGYYNTKIEGERLYPNHWFFIELSEWAIVRDREMDIASKPSPDAESLKLFDQGYLEVEGESYITAKPNDHKTRVKGITLQPIGDRLIKAPESFKQFIQS